MKSFTVGKYSNIFLQSKHKKRFFCIKTLYFVTKLLITHCLKTKKGRCNQSIHTSSFLLTYQTVLLFSRTKKNILSLNKSYITRNSCTINFIKISLKSRSESWQILWYNCQHEFFNPFTITSSLSDEALCIWKPPIIIFKWFSLKNEDTLRKILVIPRCEHALSNIILSSKYWLSHDVNMH